nr:unnamed protein product [Spirometra erinaceieuropaei]
MRQVQAGCFFVADTASSPDSGLTDSILTKGTSVVMLLHLQKLGYPDGFTQIVRQLNDGVTARVTDNGAVSGAFEVTNRAKQDCVPSPTLLSLMFSDMLMNAYCGERPEIRAVHRTGN